MTKFLANIIGYVVEFLYGIIGNYGWTIIVLTLLVRLLLLPLYNKQNKYSAAMADLQPKINEIQTRYAADRETMNEKLNEVYSQANISPLSGCLPLVIQMPIILGLFSLLRTPLLYMTSPEMITAVHESFLWIPDLSQPDAWILPIAAGLTTYLTSASAPAGDANAASMNIMKYFFPIMIFLLGKSYPAGLALYWAVGNLFTYGQTKYFNIKKQKDKEAREIEQEAQKRAKKK